MSNNHIYVRKLVTASLIAAMYAALTFAAAPISFGPVQLRISEALTILPLFTPTATVGLTVGCLISNLIGMTLGQTMGWDLLFGTFATLLAALLTYGIGRLPGKAIHYLFGPLPAVVCNGVIIGLELTCFYGGLLAVNIATVMIGEALVCYILGTLLIVMLKRNHLADKLFHTRSLK